MDKDSEQPIEVKMKENTDIPFWKFFRIHTAPDFKSAMKWYGRAILFGGLFAYFADAHFNNPIILLFVFLLLPIFFSKIILADFYSIKLRSKNEYVFDSKGIYVRGNASVLFIKWSAINNINIGENNIVLYVKKLGRKILLIDTIEEKAILNNIRYLIDRNVS